MPRGRNLSGAQWKWKPRPLGPIALLLQSASIHNATINQEMTVTSPYFANIHIVDTPWQYAQKAIYYICEGAAFHAVAFNRTTFHGIREIDRTISLSLANNIPPTPTSTNHSMHGQNQEQEQPCNREDNANQPETDSNSDDDMVSNISKASCENSPQRVHQLDQDGQEGDPHTSEQDLTPAQIRTTKTDCQPQSSRPTRRLRAQPRHW